ncbi:FkbM family methyltransferase [Aldersonia sp. NBC_00410]|uniref:FkbM family methyltransferase n=1 Tax=Aldersonia sp. NBC_00410 TaxID=2975954 RepID=UPI002259BDC8|nr:FkbM family methyltransferase [Aldersonia sp. NBC_00410]MCX5041701.1 FkbM family methyltransferase [Aldersonia sp. NBC_00410]
MDIVQYGPLKRRSTLAEAFEQMNRIGMRPATVIDVGVAMGTPELYTAFPESRFLLVDPLREWESTITELASSMGAAYERVAASDSPGSMLIRVPDSPSHATFYAKDDSGDDRDWTEYEVETARLDDLVERNGLSGPYLLKVDVEGAELEVLRGAPSVLRETLSVTLEVTLFDVFEGGAGFAEVVAFMAERDFVLYDVVGGFCRAADRALYQLDLVFLPRDSTFR